MNQVYHKKIYINTNRQIIQYQQRVSESSENHSTLHPYIHIMAKQLVQVTQGIPTPYPFAVSLLEYLSSNFFVFCFVYH